MLKCLVELAGFYLKKTPSKVEVINDINHDLVNLYRIIKYHFDAFLDEFNSLLFSREQFNDFRKSAYSMTDIQRAVRFYYILRSSFGCKLDNSFTYSKDRVSRMRFGKRLREHLNSVHERLQNVIIENCSYQDIIKRNDKVTTLFYLDPPYWNNENFYGKGIWSRDDFYQLKDILDHIHGKFILSLNNVDEVRNLFKDYRIEQAKTRWTINMHTPNQQYNDNELIICNF